MPDILGIGECMVELNADGPLDTASQFARAAGGDVYNTLAAVTKLGHTSEFVSQIAGDGFGDGLLSQFQCDGVGTAYLQRIEASRNGLYVTALNSDGGHTFTYYRQNSAASAMIPGIVTPAMVRDSKLVYASGITVALSQSCLDTVLYAFQLAKDNGVPVAYDANTRPSLWNGDMTRAAGAMKRILPYVDYLLPSLEDVQLLSGLTALQDLQDYLMHDVAVPVIAFKNGRKGVYLKADQAWQHFPVIPATRYVDSIGAGDAFDGGFIHGVLNGRTLPDSVRLGTATATLSLRERGPLRGQPNAEEAERLLASASAGIS